MKSFGAGSATNSSSPPPPHSPFGFRGRRLDSTHYFPAHLFFYHLPQAGSLQLSIERFFPLARGEDKGLPIATANGFNVSAGILRTGHKTGGSISGQAHILVWGDLILILYVDTLLLLVCVLCIYYICEPRPVMWGRSCLRCIVRSSLCI